MEGCCSTRLRKISGDPVGESVEASVPGIKVEAAQHLREDASERITDSFEVFLGDTRALDVLISQMVKVTLKDEGVVEEVDQEVHTVGDTNQVGAELATVRAVDLHPLKQLPG